jgi:hypothetical protein
MARSLNGSTDFITITGGTSTLTSATPQSVSLWVYVTAYPASLAGLVVLRGGGGGSFVALYIESDGKLQAYMSVGGINPGNTIISLNTWTNVVLTTDGGATGTMATFIAGSADATVSGSNVSGYVTPLSGVTCNIGADEGFASTRRFNGRIADVGIWNGAALTALEIKALSLGVRPGVIRPKSLQIWFPLSGLQSPEPDLSGSATSSTLTGTTSAFDPPLLPFTRRWPQKLIDAVVSPFTLMPQIIT